MGLPGGMDAALSTDVRHDDLRDNPPEKFDKAIDVWRDELVLVTGVSGSAVSGGRIGSPCMSSRTETLSCSAGMGARAGCGDTKTRPLRL